MKVLVTHVPAGSGHEKAAEAVHLALREKHPGVESVLLNGLEGMSPCYQWTFTQGYIGMIHRYPHVWGFLYHLADLRGLAWAAYKLHRLSNSSHGRNLEQIFLRHHPDAIVATHFFPVEVASYLKQKGRLRSRIIAVITDFLPHSVWISPGVDLYAVGGSATRDELIRRGIPGDRIRVVGIPVAPHFKRRHERRALAQRLGVNPDLFTVLVGSGGSGTGPVGEEASSFRSAPERMQLLIVTGKNSALYQHLEGIRETIPHELKIYRFVDNMHELMDVSDVMVTKPGGLSCSEAMAKGLPLVLTAAIPGQESRNAKVLSRMGAAILCARPGGLPACVHRLRTDPGLLRKMAQAGREHARPDACYDVARLAVEKEGALPL